MCLSCHIICLESSEDLSDPDVWEKVCIRKGWQFLRNHKSYTWFGTWVDDSPVPPGLFEDKAEYKRVVSMPRKQRVAYMQQLLGHCEHAIRIPGHFCEIGLVRVGNNLFPVWDWASTLPSVLGYPTDPGWKDPLLMEYVTSKAELQAERLGYCYTTTFNAKNNAYEIEVWL